MCRAVTAVAIRAVCCTKPWAGNLLLLAVDSGGERFLCAGPVLSHYEVEVTGAPRRLSDEEWQSIATSQRFPDDAEPRRFEGLAPPPWTRSYLVPRPPE